VVSPLLDDVYYCPTAGENESAKHGGFDVCCDRPERHEPARRDLAPFPQDGVEW
jgi:hypothetical protein